MSDNNWFWKCLFCPSCPFSFPWSSIYWSTLVLHLIITCRMFYGFGCNLIFLLVLSFSSKEDGYLLVNDSATLENASNQIHFLLNRTSCLNCGIADINHFKILSQLLSSEASHWRLYLSWNGRSFFLSPRRLCRMLSAVAGQPCLGPFFLVSVPVRGNW